MYFNESSDTTYVIKLAKYNFEIVFESGYSFVFGTDDEATYEQVGALMLSTASYVEFEDFTGALVGIRPYMLALVKEIK
jgi:hypothetical protein